MEKCILIRYGEIFLKSGNRPFFEGLLKKNIRQALKGIKFSLSVSQARYFIESYNEADENAVIESLKRIFGIHSLSVCYKVDTDIEKIGLLLSEVFQKTGKFRISVNRADKRIKQSSMEIAKYLGHVLLESGSGRLSVDLHDFDYEINADIRENGYTYLFFDKISGAGGLPVGCSGKGLLLLSGGIDSPVAGYMIAKRGMSVSALHFYSIPFTSPQAKEKVGELAEILKRYTSGMTVYFVKFTKIQEAIHQKCPNEYLITIMRRFMMRIAEKISDKYGFDAVITGESLGQVASQTVESLTSTADATSKLILRPLIGFDKNEIIDIAKTIDTYTTSIQPYEDCCTVFLPKNPSIRPKPAIVTEAEKALDIDVLVDEALSDMEIVNL